MRKKGDRASCLLREVRAQTEAWFDLSRGFEQVDSLQDSGRACSMTIFMLILTMQYIFMYNMYSKSIGITKYL